MSSGVRKRNSKWDLKEEFQPSLRHVRDYEKPGKSGSRFHGKGSEDDLLSPEGSVRNDIRQSVRDGSDKLNPGPDIRLSSRESFPKSRGSFKGDGRNEDSVKILKPATERERNGSRSTKISPGLDEGRHHSLEYDRRRSQRSRSRSRSRSPVRGFKKQSGLYDRSKDRSGASAKVCEDFSAGRSRRGNDCQFLQHDGKNIVDNWESRNREAKDSKYSTPRDSRSSIDEYSRGRGSDRTGGDALLVEIHGSGCTSDRRGSDRRGRDALLVHGSERTSADILCKYFAAGYCRNGKSCRFRHHVDAEVSPNGELCGDRSEWSHKSNDVHPVLNGSRWSDMEKSDTVKSSEVKNGQFDTFNQGLSGYPMDGRLDDSFNENGIHGALAANHKAEIAEWKAETTGIGKSGLIDMEMSPDWNYEFKHSTNIINEDHGHGVSHCSQSLSQNNTFKHDTSTALQPLVTQNSYFQQNHSLGHDGPGITPCNNRHVAENSVTSQLNLGISASNMPPQSVNHNGHRALPYPSFFGGLSVNNPENGAAFQERKLMNPPDVGKPEISRVNFATPPVQNTVSTGQLNQLTNLSASLAQLLANGQQIPQFYTALNPQNALQAHSFTDSGGTLKSNSSVTIQPNQAAIALQKQYAVSDSTEATQNANGAKAERIPVISIGQDPVDVKTDMPHKSLNSSSFEISNGEYFHISHGLQKEQTYEGHCLNQQEPAETREDSKEKSDVRSEESDEEQEDEKNAEESGPLEHLDNGKKADGKKKAKTSKAIRAFKFALVEEVKKILKPTWKEGQMGRDDYKNMVKKIVDKVTVTMKDGNIPQTQDKIDKYLSVSKPKLTKLVEAYVEKFQKSQSK